MKIDKEIQDAKFEILDYRFCYNKNEDPQITFKLGLVDQGGYDPMWLNLSLLDKNIGWSLHNLRYMTGIVIESLFDIDPESSDQKHNLIGKSFISDIVQNGQYFNIQFPDAKKSKNIKKDKLKDLDKRLKKHILEYAVGHPAEEEI